MEPMVHFKVTTSIHPLKSPMQVLQKFTVVMLQQYTIGFSYENFIGEGMLGSVYRGKLPD